jgi:Fusaric acid resistance protein-like
VSGARDALAEMKRIDRSAFNLPEGLRAGAFVCAPLLLGIVTGQLQLVYTTLAALLLTNTQGPHSSQTPIRPLFAACFIEAVAFGLGTLVGTTGWVSVPLIGIGIFLALTIAAFRGWGWVAMSTAIFFAVGVGLPGGSVAAAGDRLIFALPGSLWAFSGILSRHVWISHRGSAARSKDLLSQVPPTTRSESINHAVTVAAVSAIGHGIGLALDLPRGFWIVVTIIIALRPRLGPTVSTTSLIVIGTAVGAVIAASVTLTISGDYLLWAMLLAFSVALFATRAMNLGLTQVFITPFIIILLNIIYPGQWQLAEVRILDVAIGGAISMLTVGLFWVRRHPPWVRHATLGAPPKAGENPPARATARKIYCD